MTQKNSGMVTTSTVVRAQRSSARIAVIITAVMSVLALILTLAGLTVGIAAPVQAAETTLTASTEGVGNTQLAITSSRKPVNGTVCVANATAVPIADGTTVVQPGLPIDVEGRFIVKQLEPATAYVISIVVANAAGKICADGLADGDTGSLVATTDAWKLIADEEADENVRVERDDILNTKLRVYVKGNAVPDVQKGDRVVFAATDTGARVVENVGTVSEGGQDFSFGVSALVPSTQYTIDFDIYGTEDDENAYRYIGATGTTDQWGVLGDVVIAADPLTNTWLEVSFDAPIEGRPFDELPVKGSWTAEELTGQFETSLSQESGDPVRVIFRIEGLQPETTYDVIFDFVANDGVGYRGSGTGETAEFETLPLVTAQATGESTATITVTTATATGIDADQPISVTAEGSAISIQSKRSTEVVANTVTELLLAGLTPGTTYRFGVSVVSADNVGYRGVAGPITTSTPVLGPGPAPAPAPSPASAVAPAPTPTLTPIPTPIDPIQSAVNLVLGSTPSQVQQFSAAQLAELPPEAFAAMTSAQVRALNPRQVTALRAAQIRAIPPSSLRAMKPRTLARFSTAQIRSLTERQAKRLRSVQIRALSPAQQRNVTAKRSR